MCENCITGLLAATGEQNIRCPLCKTFCQENPLDFEAISEDMLKIDEPVLRRKGEYVDQETGETFLQMWDRVMKRRVAPPPTGVIERRNIAAEAVTIVQPNVIDLTVADMVDLTNM